MADIPADRPTGPTCSDCWTTSAPGRLMSSSSTRSTVGAALKDADFVVEAFDEAEGDFVFRPAVGGDAVPVTLDHCGELFIWLEALPAQLSFPVVEKATCPCLRLVIPKLVEGLTKDVGRVQALIGVEQKLKAFSAFSRQVPSSAASRQVLLPCSVSGVATSKSTASSPNMAWQQLAPVADKRVLGMVTIGTIIRRESHWQSRVLRNDLH
jgi:hypothetical protein